MFKLKLWLFLLLSHSLCAITAYVVTESSDSDPGGRGMMGELRFYLNEMNQELNGGSLENYAFDFQTPMTITLNGILPIINSSSHPAIITIGRSDDLLPKKRSN